MWSEGCSTAANRRRGRRRDKNLLPPSCRESGLVISNRARAIRAKAPLATRPTTLPSLEPAPARRRCGESRGTTEASAAASGGSCVLDLRISDHFFQKRVAFMHRLQRCYAGPREFVVLA